ncbi:MAG: lysophospholipid acyltransferase family protein [Flavobacteriaceae bacterium]
MQFLAYILVYPLLWFISILPFRLFYFFSDLIFLVMFYLIGYRKRVVLENLTMAFPDKSAKELKDVQRCFYRHMCDMFLEMIKTLNLTKEELKERYKIINIEVLQSIVEDKSVLIVCSHYANWEWNVSINNYVDAKGYAVYQKIGNVYFDNLIKKIRAKWNTTLITQQETVKTVYRNVQNGTISAYGMVSDQSPQVKKAQYWSEFMGVKVPIFNGPESMARKLDLAVVFLKVSKVKRGYYQAEFIPITMAGSKTQKHQITDQFLRLTENQIREKPAYYLWTHKRWKHRNKVPVEFQ